MNFGAVVIGGSVGGLAAAAYLARAGAHVTLFEARSTLGGRAETAALGNGFQAPLVSHTAYALDARMLRDLKLHKHGLRFAERDMKLVALRPGGRHIVIARDAYAARGELAAHAPADTDSYVRFRRETFALARRLRPLWMSAGADGGVVTPEAAAQSLKLSHRDTRSLQALARTSASAYLDRWFESDALKAALAFDTAEGFSPHEAGSALALLWRGAQESCGLQGAVSQIEKGPGALAQALARAAEAAGVELRTAARVSAIEVEDGRATGVVLDNGDSWRASAILSSLSRRRTLIGLAPAGALALGTTANLLDGAGPASGAGKLLLALDGLPPFAGIDEDALRGRLVVAERPESAAEAKGAALAGRLPNELLLEATVPSVADTSLSPDGQHVMSVRIPYLPLLPEKEWAVRRDVLAERVIGTLESFAPGLRNRIVARQLITPGDIAARYGTDAQEAEPNVWRLLAPGAARVRTRLAGLYLCGASAEPCSALSGCAGRIAAALACADASGGRA